MDKYHLQSLWLMGNRDPSLFKIRLVQEIDKTFLVSKLMSVLVVGNVDFDQTCNLAFEINGTIQIWALQDDRRSKIGPYYPIKELSMACRTRELIELALKWHWSL